MFTKFFARMREIRNNSRKVLTMNKRNLNFIYPNNKRRDFPIADNKLLTKETLKNTIVSVPRTMKTYDSFYGLASLAADLSTMSNFVIKPAQGSGGGGIVVIIRREGNYWYSAGGKPYDIEKIKRHITDIIFGVYSFGLSDVAIVEQRICQHPFMEKLSPLGLADLRIIMLKNKPVMCMSRIPTKQSDGKANLHQGAVGIGISVDNGITTNAILGDVFITHHPDTNEPLLGHTLPFWTQIIEMSRAAAEEVPLKYLGVDIALSVDGPVLLEINVRPGLQIQNANQAGMRQVLDTIQKGDLF